jgi:hypothetical protein
VRCRFGNTVRIEIRKLHMRVVYQTFASSLPNCLAILDRIQIFVM